MNANLPPSVYGPIVRYNAHQLWAPEGSRVWTDSTRLLGHTMIEAYPDIAAGQESRLPSNAAYTPGEFMSDLIGDEAAGEFVDNMEKIGLGSCDYDTDWDAYWSSRDAHLKSHAGLPSAGIAAAHELWEKRFNLAYDTESAQNFIAKAREWSAGFELGAHRLIDDGTLPMTHQTFTRRLEHPAELGYVPLYVQRLNFLQRGESAVAAPNGGSSDHCYGILYNNAVGDDPDIERSRFIHELGHFYLDGLHSRFTVMDSGDRIALDNHIGMWEIPISHSAQEMEEGMTWNGGASRHMELNEGGTEYLTAEIHRVVPELGQFASRGLYKGWHAVWRRMERDAVDLLPFLGYKVTDQGYDTETLDHRIRWYGAMQEEFARVYVPRLHHGDVNFGFPALDNKIGALTATSDSRNEDTSKFADLLQKPSRALRLAEGLGRGHGALRSHDRMRQSIIRPPIT